MNDTHPHSITPQLSRHARERCAEMGISTKVAKRIWQQWSVKRAMHDQKQTRLMVTSAAEPDYALVVDTDQEVPLVITVLFNESEEYVRRGSTYEVRGA